MMYAYVVLRKCQGLIGLNTMSDDYRLGKLRQQFVDVVDKVNVEAGDKFPLSLFLCLSSSCIFHMLLDHESVCACSRAPDVE